MKQVEKLLGVNSSEFGELVPMIKTASTRMYKEYQQ